MTTPRFVTLTEGGQRRSVDLLSLPQVTLTTAGAAPIVSKEDYVNGTFTLDGQSPVASRAMQIRGRGNSTWAAQKKPYRIKLASAVSLVPGVEPERDWVLLAAFYDPAYVRTLIGMELAERTSGMAWNPGFRPVEVTLNGDFIGLYLLGEHVEVGTNRIPITVPSGSTTSGIALTGGYSLEIDNRAVDNEGGGFRTATGNVPVAMDDPKNEVPAQREYLQGWFENLEARMMAPTWLDPVEGYRPKVDFSSAADFFIVTELCAIADAGNPLSLKMYKKRDTASEPGKLFFGPIWDLDNSMGNYFRGPQAQNWTLRNVFWFDRMMEDPEFQSLVSDRWTALRDGLDSWLPDYIERTLAVVWPAAYRDQRRWGWTPLSHRTYRDELLAWFDQRVAWLDDQLDTA